MSTSRHGTDHALLDQVLRDLRHAGEQAAMSWQDDAQAHFRQAHLDPIMERLHLAARTLGQIQELLDGAERDCGP